MTVTKFAIDNGLEVMKVRLTKIESTHSNLRTDLIEGKCIDLPEIGESFFVVAPPLDPTKDFRMVNTSEVKELTTLPDGKILFKTANSTYEIEIL